MLFRYTDNSLNLVNKLIEKNPELKKYNSNLGVFFDRFIASNIYRNNDDNWDGKITLNKTEYLRKIFPKSKTEEILNILMQENIIEIDKSYRSGLFSKGYKIVVPGFYDFKEIKRKRIKNKILIKNLNLLEDKRSINLTPLQKKLENFLQEFKLNRKAALKHIKCLLKTKEIDENKYYSWKIKIEDWDYKNILKPDLYGRCHTKISTFPKRLRQFLSIDKENLANIDLKSSQMVFLGLYLESLPDLKEEEKNELDKYLDSVFNKDVYSIFECNKNKSRDYRKIQMFHVLFGKPSLVKHSELYKEMELRFPLLMERMNEIKTPKHNLLAILLQGMEGNFIYHKVSKHLLENFPEIKFATIHDSFLVLPKYKETVIGVIKNLFYQNYNKNLNIGVTNYE